MSTISATTQLQRTDVFRVAALLLLRHSASILLMAAGPVLALTGLVTGSSQVTDAGAGMLPVTAAVVLVALLQGSLGAYRPGLGDIYEPVTWEFAEDGIDIEQPSRRACAEWGEFRDWRRVAGCYVLYVSRTRYVIVPMRDIAEADRSRLEDLFEEKLGPRRR